MATGKDKNVYELLRQRTGLAKSATMMRILRGSYTSGEAELVLALPRAVPDARLGGGPGPQEEQGGATAEEVAKETGRDLGHVKETLHRMWDRNLIGRRMVDGVPHYFGGGRINKSGGFLDTIRRTWSEDERTKLGLLISKFDFEEGGILHQFSQFKVPSSAVRVAERAVANKEELETWEKASEIIKNSKERALAECWCRVRSQDYNSCDKPVTTCHVNDVHLESVEGFDRGTLRLATAEECLENLEMGQDAGLVSIATNTSDPAAAHWICACCPDCCHILACSGRLQVPVGQAFVKSNFDPVFSVEKCNWCLACVKICPNQACWWHPPHEADESDKEIRFRLDRCVGCGLCGVACRTEAIRMHKVRNYVPPAPTDPGRTERVGWV